MPVSLSKYAVGFTFTDNLWGDPDQGEIIQIKHTNLGYRYIVRWVGGSEEFSFEKAETIDSMIKGE